jgi:NACalpha-BTF3-like transcription factor
MDELITWKDREERFRQRRFKNGKALLFARKLPSDSHYIISQYREERVLAGRKHWKEIIQPRILELIKCSKCKKEFVFNDSHQAEKGKLYCLECWMEKQAIKTMRKWIDSGKFPNFRGLKVSTSPINEESNVEPDYLHILMVCREAEVSEEAARAELIKTDGDMARAILKLKKTGSPMKDPNYPLYRCKSCGYIFETKPGLCKFCGNDVFENYDPLHEPEEPFSFQQKEAKI